MNRFKEAHILTSSSLTLLQSLGPVVNPFPPPQTYSEPEFVNLFKETQGLIPSLQPIDVPARQATKAGGIDSWAP